MEPPFVSICENLSFENALKKCKKQHERGGILSEIKEREYFEKPSIKRGKQAVAVCNKTIKRVKLAVR